MRSKNAVPQDRRAGQDRHCAGSRTPALLILRRGLRQQDSLTRGQRRSRRPRDTTGGASTDATPLTVMMVASAHHLITPASVTGCLQLDLDKTPLTRSAVWLTRATQGRREIAPRTRNIGSGGQYRRRPSSDQPSGHAVPTEPGWDSTGEHVAREDCQDHPLPQKIARIKPVRSRPTEWAPTTDKDESHPDGAKTQC